MTIGGLVDSRIET